LASAWAIAWRIHGTAYVEKRVPRRQSYFSAARISPNALLQQVLHGQPAADVPARHGADEPQVAADERVLGRQVSAFDAARQPVLLGGGEESVLGEGPLGVHSNACFDGHPAPYNNRLAGLSARRRCL
jgi:hypothetical protein